MNRTKNETPTKGNKNNTNNEEGITEDTEYTEDRSTNDTNETPMKLSTAKSKEHSVAKAKWRDTPSSRTRSKTSTSTSKSKNHEDTANNDEDNDDNHSNNADGKANNNEDDDDEATQADLNSKIGTLPKNTPDLRLAQAFIVGAVATIATENRELKEALKSRQWQSHPTNQTRTTLQYRDQMYCQGRGRIWRRS